MKKDKLVTTEYEGGSNTEQGVIIKRADVMPVVSVSKKKRTVRMRSDEVNEAPKNYGKSYAWAFLGAFFFGIANCFNADLGQRHGTTGPWCAWPAFIISFCVYHSIMYCVWKRKSKPGESYFDKKNSMYYEEFRELDSDEPDEMEGGKKVIEERKVETFAKDEDQGDTVKDTVAAAAFVFQEECLQKGNSQSSQIQMKEINNGSMNQSQLPLTKNGDKEAADIEMYNSQAIKSCEQIEIGPTTSAKGIVNQENPEEVFHTDKNQLQKKSEEQERNIQLDEQNGSEVFTKGSKSNKQTSKGALEMKEERPPKIILMFSSQKVLGSISRVFVTLCTEVTILITFEYAFKSGVNPGIIASCFSMNIPVTAIIFYYTYGNPITCQDVFGSILIITSVFMIAIGGGGDGSHGTSKLTAQQQKEALKEADTNLFLALGFSLLTSIAFGLNAWSLKYNALMKNDMMQCNFDGNLGLFCLFFPVYVILVINNPDIYSWRDMICGTSILSFVTAASICIGQALTYGDGGPVQAIENQKNPIQTVIAALLIMKLPTWLQLGGLLVGSIGVFTIVFKPNPADKKKKDEQNAENKKAKEQALHNN